MGKLLSQVQECGVAYARHQEHTDVARSALRLAMKQAHDEGISMNKIAIAAGMTREGVRYALKGGQ